MLLVFDSVCPGMASVFQLIPEKIYLIIEGTNYGGNSCINI